MKLKKTVLICILCLAAVCLTANTVFARASKTDYPVVFAHGMMGFDKILGLYYFGTEFGGFVGDPDDNANLNRRQKAFAASVNPFQSSEIRGLELADDIENYMATVGADHVNIVGHSQGGLDARKAARVLFDRKGEQVVKVLVSISSPHRGSPIAKKMLDAGDEAFTSLITFLADYLASPILYKNVTAGDFEAAMKAFHYGDYEPNDGEITGAKAFNEKYGIDDTYIHHYASIITADEEERNPILGVMGLIVDLSMDADGWGGSGDVDWNGDGAAGTGDGDIWDGDDDGLVGMNSQQMGYRLAYTSRWFFGNYFTEDNSTGYVADINNPDETQSTSMSSVLNEDHLDVCGLGKIPFISKDDFPETEFYADLIDYIAENEGSGGWWFW